ncbi:endolytic transglycosylase MltG [Pengzhenrongella sp.]|uniref:endolytic transglycosylase MltG n=1 Tax=Pengzhenrongella sp. TaxID=2888820 RepID=UPI002F95AFAA
MSEIFADPDPRASLPPTEVSRSGRRGAGKAAKAAKRRKRRRRNFVVVVALLLLAGAAYVVVGFLAPLFDGASSAKNGVSDYPGPGHGTAQVVVSPGETGTAIGAALVKAGVVATQDSFTSAQSANPHGASIQSGTYELKLEMKASDAVTALLDAKKRVSYTVTVQEGLTASQIFEKVSSVTTIPIPDLKAAAKGKAIGLPAEAGGNAEGWLGAATYSFEPKSTATQILKQMVTKTISELDDLSVPANQREKVLIRASLVEREGRLPQDLPKIARAIDNRLGREMPLDIDSSLAYGLGRPGTGLTNADKNSNSTYNLYRVTGLPPSPIASPGPKAIAAVLSPAIGNWLYWVTVNLDTGETLFADNLNDHNANVQKLRAWQEKHPG